MRLFILIRRDPSETHEEFMQWWAGDHADLAVAMPGLGRYVLHEVTGGFEHGVEWDGLAELEFESADAAKAAFAAPEGLETLAHASGRRGARLMLLTETLRVARES